jgi:hypothetical protein
LLSFLEERSLPYIIVARMTRTLKVAAASIKDWTPLDANCSTASLTLQLHGWSRTWRFVVIRELEREDKSAVGRRLIEVPGYTYRIFVTNRDEDPVTLWRDYNQGACIKQRIEELKNDLADDGFCMRQFYATEAAFLSVLFALLRCAHPFGAACRLAVSIRSAQHAESLPASHRHAQSKALPASGDAAQHGVPGWSYPSNRARQPVL